MVREKVDFNALAKQALDTAVTHGWHDEARSTHHYLMLVITEISEAVNADRKQKHAEITRFESAIQWYQREFHTDRWVEYFEEYVKDTVEDEIADVVIRCLDLLGYLDVELSELNEIRKAVDFTEERTDAVAKDSFTEWAYSTVGILIECELKDDIAVGLKSCILSCFIKSDYMGFDLMKHVDYKMQYNRLRSYRHGGKLY